MTRQERYHYILDYFRKHEPHVTTELQFGSAFQLLVATLLSAQCTDKRINAVTPALFAKYPTAEAMARAEVEDVLEFVSSVSYPNAKARHLVAMARQLVADYGGEVPSDPQELVKLQGVGRKTANVLQAVWFGKPVSNIWRSVFRRKTYRRPIIGCCFMDGISVRVRNRSARNVPSTRYARSC